MQAVPCLVELAARPCHRPLRPWQRLRAGPAARSATPLRPTGLRHDDGHVAPGAPGHGGSARRWPPRSSRWTRESRPGRCPLGATAVTAPISASPHGAGTHSEASRPTMSADSRSRAAVAAALAHTTRWPNPADRPRVHQQHRIGRQPGRGRCLRATPRILGASRASSSGPRRSDSRTCPRLVLRRVDRGPSPWVGGVAHVPSARCRALGAVPVVLGETPSSPSDRARGGDFPSRCRAARCSRAVRGARRRALALVLAAAPRAGSVQRARRGGRSAAVRPARAAKVLSTGDGPEPAGSVSRGSQRPLRHAVKLVTAVGGGPATGTGAPRPVGWTRRGGRSPVPVRR